MNQSSILLETGTNEVELLEFDIGDQYYCINVLKIKQIIKFEPEKLTKQPNKNPAVLGMLLHRDKVIPIIDLNLFFDIPARADNSRRIVIICEFNETLNGFVVDATSNIHRLEWGDIQVVNLLNDLAKSEFINGIVALEDKQIQMPDFEKIIASLFEVDWFKIPDIDITDLNNEELNTKKEKLKIVCVDDSSLIRKSLKQVFEKVQINNVTLFKNGIEALEYILKCKQEAAEKGEDLSQYINLVITDIEMPKMDGLTLCKQVKSEIPTLPVIVLSSLITQQIIIKCKEVKANNWLAKNEMGQILKIIQEIAF